jgi:REP element-mobilizing transposase RayT
MDRRHNIYRTPKIAPNHPLQESDLKQLKSTPFALDAKKRSIVEQAVRNVCEHRRYILRGINVRTNHVHIVATAAREPEALLEAFKSYSTRELRKSGVISQTLKPWIRHGSTIYLWKERDVAKAIEYVMLSQGDDLFRLDDDE